MISVILLVFTVILIAIGGVCGFRRGIVKQGVRMALWGVLFVGSCFFIPQLADKLPLLVAERFDIAAVDVEQLIAELLKKIEFLRKETYLILPLAAFIRSLLVPFLIIAFYWVSGLVSEFLFLIIAAIFFRNKEKKPAAGCKVAGLVFGVMLALFGGMLTLYPLAEISSAVKIGDETQKLTQEFAAAELLADSYEGAPVQLLYKFTGTEWLADKVHTAAINRVISAEEHNLWAELPNIVRIGSCGFSLYSGIDNMSATEAVFEQELRQTVDAYFSLGFISDDNQLLLLKRLKSAFGKASGNEAVIMLLDWLAVDTKEQLVSDASVYGAVFDILKAEGILDAVLGEQETLILTEEAGDALVNKLYSLSNAEVVIPGFINRIYSTLLGDEEAELIQTENLVLNEQTRADISEVVSVICRMSSLIEDMDSLSTEQKKIALDAVKDLKDNETVGKENYAALLRYIMGMM